jgi:bifunctional DNA-binding transcriptional regulator/antitoxin component of YhaV-PrlF toxin-antitoxin module
MISATVGAQGEIDLPDDVRERYGLLPNSSIRIVETRSGILIVPVSEEPMSAELERELAEWQSLTHQAWETFPYEADAE